MPDTATDDSGFIDRMLQQLMSGQTQPPPGYAPPQQQPQQDQSIVSLLGHALSGGGRGERFQGADREDAGRQALFNIGINMLANSGYSERPKTFGQILAAGMGAGQESLANYRNTLVASDQAQFERAKTLQEMQLARVKEAIPLLNLKQQLAIRKAISDIPSPLGPQSSAAPSASIATAGVSEADVPPELLPIYKQAAARAGVPLSVLLAMHKQESGFDPAKTGGAGEVGLGQILPSTAQNPGYGMKGVDPATLKDPTANINFSADYLAAKAKANGVTNWNDPAQVDRALALYNGGGDKNYVANVRRYMPGQQPAAPPPGAPAPAQAGAPPPAAPFTRAPLPAPEPASGGQMAGPGVPVGQEAEQPGNQALLNSLHALGGTPPPPQSPGAPAAADAIAAGMVAQGADPRTLATGGPASPPGGAPAPGGPDQPAAAPGVPKTFKEWLQQNPIVPNAEEEKLFDVKPNPAQAANIAQQLRVAQHDLAVARASGDPAKISAADQAYNTVLGNQSTMLENAAKLGRDARSNWMDKRTAEAHTAWQAAVADANKQAETQRSQDFEIRKLQEQARLKLQETEDSARVQRDTEVFNKLNKDTLDARGAASNLSALLTISNTIDRPSVWGKIPFLGGTVLDYAAQLGIVGKDTATASQLLQSAITNTVARMRSGMPMGNLSDKDLSFIENMAPTMFQNRETRAAVISYLHRAQDQIGKYNLEVTKLMSKPGMTMGEALDTASTNLEKNYPIVPIRPKNIDDDWENKSPEAVEARKKWMRNNNIRPGTMFRRQDGGLEILYSPEQAPPSVQVPH